MSHCCVPHERDAPITDLVEKLTGSSNSGQPHHTSAAYNSFGSLFALGPSMGDFIAKIRSKRINSKYSLIQKIGQGGYGAVYLGVYASRPLVLRRPSNWLKDVIMILGKTSH